MPKDYSKIREMLESQETFPLDYVHKLIGKNSAVFEESLKAFESRFPAMRRQFSRPSASGNHLAVTFLFRAQNVDEIIQILEASEQLPDLVMQL